MHQKKGRQFPRRGGIKLKKQTGALLHKRSEDGEKSNARLGTARIIYGNLERRVRKSIRTRGIKQKEEGRLWPAETDS